MVEVMRGNLIYISIPARCEGLLSPITPTASYLLSIYGECSSDSLRGAKEFSAGQPLLKYTLNTDESGSYVCPTLTQKHTNLSNNPKVCMGK